MELRLDIRDAIRQPNGDFFWPIPPGCYPDIIIVLDSEWPKFICPESKESPTETYTGDGNDDWGKQLQAH
jgi:hypothetical protein